MGTRLAAIIVLAGTLWSPAGLSAQTAAPASARPAWGSVPLRQAPAVRAQPPSVPPDRWLAPDKLRHLTTSAVLTGVAFQGYDRLSCTSRRAQGCAALSALALGVLKEVRDRRKTYFGWKDLIADVAGIALGVAAFAP